MKSHQTLNVCDSKEGPQEDTYYRTSGQYIISYKKHLEILPFKPTSLYQNIQTLLQPEICGWKVIQFSVCISEK